MLTAVLQVLSYSAACVCVSAFSGGLIDAAKAEELMNTLRRLTEESQQVGRTPACSCRCIAVSERC